MKRLKLQMYYIYVNDIYFSVEESDSASSASEVNESDEENTLSEKSDVPQKNCVSQNQFLENKRKRDHTHTYSIIYS